MQSEYACNRQKRRTEAMAAKCKLCKTSAANQGFDLCQKCYQASAAKCRTCHKAPPTKGYKRCQACYEASLKPPPSLLDGAWKPACRDAPALRRVVLPVCV